MTMTLLDILVTGGITATLTLVGIWATRRITGQEGRKQIGWMAGAKEDVLTAIRGGEQTGPLEPPQEYLMIDLAALSLAIVGRGKALDEFRSTVTRVIDGMSQTPAQGTPPASDQTVEELKTLAEFLLRYREVVENVDPPVRLPKFAEFRAQSRAR